MRPVELTADVPVKLPDYIGVTDQRVYAKLLPGGWIEWWIFADDGSRM